MVSDDLTKNYEEIIQFLENKKFSIFYAKNSSTDDFFPQIQWDNDKNWDEFFSIAKNHNISTVVIETEIFHEEDFKEFNDSIKESDLTKEYLEKMNLLLKELQIQQDKIGSFVFSWVEDGIRYCFVDKTKWFEEFETEFAMLEKKEKLEHDSKNIKDRDELPDEITDTSKEELAENLLRYILNEFPNPSRNDVYHAESIFWEEKGLNRHFGSKSRLLISKVSVIVSKKLEEMEKEKIPKLVDECIQWANENELSKILKTNVIGFLSEKGIELSSNNKNILHNKVNLKLKSS